MQEKQIISLLECILEDAKAAGANSADAVHVDATDISVSQRLGKPEDLERAESSGVGIRAFVDGKYAMVSSTDLSHGALKEAAQRAVAMAKASIADPFSRLAEAGEWGSPKEGLDLFEQQEPALEWMREQCAACEDAARSHEGITNSEGASMSASRYHITTVSSVGKAAKHSASSLSLSVSVLGGSGAQMERDYAYSAVRHSSDLRAAEAIGHEAAERTLRRLNPRKQATQRVPVVFDPRVGRSLLGQFASAISGAAVARGTSFLKSKRGEEVFSPQIQIIDDPHLVRGLGSKPLDGEGLANAPLHLVQHGVLKDWLLDLRSANQLGMCSNARASRSLASPPSPSSTNLYMQAGSISPEAMISEIHEGFYVTDTFGMGVNLVTGDYSQGASGFWIENGALAYPVSELTIAGHLLEMFRTITPASDLRFDYATNTPTLRIERMMIAGA